MFEVNCNKIMTELVSDDLETQCLAAAAACAVMKALTEQTIKGLESSSVPVLMAEQLGTLGKIVPDQLEILYKSRERDEVRVTVAITLLFLGSKIGVDDLIQSVRDCDAEAQTALFFLVRAKVPGTDQLVVERLRKFSSEELSDAAKFEHIDSVLRDLQELGAPLPDDLREQFEQVTGLPDFLKYSVPPAGQ